MYILFVILITGSNPVDLKTQEFESSANCMQYIQKLIEMETKLIKIKATCLKK
jgi:hypothetical protein